MWKRNNWQNKKAIYWKKIFGNHISDKELISKIHKELHNSIAKKTKQSDLKMDRLSSKETYRWPAGTWKDAQQHSSSGKCKSKPYWDITSHLLEWLLSKWQEIIMLSRMWRKGSTCILLLGWEGCKTGTATMENSVEDPQNIKNRTTTCAYLSKENESTNSKRYMFLPVHFSMIYNNQSMVNQQCGIYILHYMYVYILTIEYYPATKRIKSCHLQHRWSLRAKWHKWNRERQIMYYFTYMWNLKKKKEKTKLIDIENRLGVVRDGRKGVGETDKGNQKLPLYDK